jgi:hypothetical protein
MNAVAEAAARPNSWESRMKKKQLSPPQQWVIERCQEVRFGRVAFRVFGGAPDLTHPWGTRKTVKLSGDGERSRTPAAKDDFALCKEQVALLAALAQVHDGACVNVEVRHGLPFLVEINQDNQAA